jgi:hypothetical protein
MPTFIFKPVATQCSRDPQLLMCLCLLASDVFIELRHHYCMLFLVLFGGMSKSRDWLCFSDIVSQLALKL